ncbi:YwmB family TATA-box binding protein [Metabacillus sp. Hm71]|uniref:YwmB family TATA-box binding protein n=1 Tax=Metabacillus sp. Hm71 TaxID=3450743 RepID=UPI003F4450D7
MRKKEIAAVIFTMILVFTLVANHIGAEGNESKISLLADGMEKQNVRIDTWSLYAKNSVEKKSIKEVKQMVDQLRQYKWVYEKDGEVFKAVGVFENKKKNITEKLQILTTLTNNHSTAYILYQVTGVGAQPDWDKVNEYFHEQSFDIFHENVTTFACLQGLLDDNMKVSLYEKSRELVNEFNANPVEQLQEKDFISISGKTPLWEDFIPTDNDKINIQIALRTDEMGDYTSVVIGTPIITSEY